MPDNNPLLDHLVSLTEEISLGNYSEAQKLFALTKHDDANQEISALAEAFGMMLCQVEGRQFHNDQLMNELKQTNETLEETLQQLDERTKFMFTLVHELKSPLATAKMMLDVVSLKHKDDERIADVTTAVSKRMETVFSLIEEILLLSNADEPCLNNKPEPIQISSLTEEIFNNYIEQAEAQDLTMTLEMPDAPVTADFEPKIFKIVLSNLLSNAVKYTKVGSVSVKIASVDDKTQISVTDSGMGIPEAEMKQMFTPFFRASNALSSGVRGTGVGLASIHKFAKQFGAELSVVSTEGKGSTFTLTL